MKKFYLTLLAALIGASSSVAAMRPDFYHKRSQLSQGKWIKITVDQSGIYEISYETLRQMGFANPSQVGIFGRGGMPLSPNFVSVGGSTYLNDELPAVKVWHHNNKIYFLGIGPKDTQIVTQSSSILPIYFSRLDNNIYSDKGVYFLTDTKASDSLNIIDSSNNISDDIPVSVNECVGYIYHEEDIAQNNSGTGQLFWERNINSADNNQLTYDINIPDAIPNSSGWLGADIYLNLEDTQNAAISYGLVGNQNPFSFQGVSYASSYFKQQQTRGGYIGINPGKQQVFFKITGNIPSINALDYWVLSYKSYIPTLRSIDMPQSRFAISGLKRSQPTQFSISDASTYVVYNNTDSSNPSIIIPSVAGGQSTFNFAPTASYSDMWVFDTSRPQLQISSFSDSFSPVDNQDLHQYSYEGADLLIITIPRLLPYAERLAESHRQKQGIKVVVATTEQCYNEFSGGVPDPMAYRSLAKMLYMGQTQLKNILLFGPMTNELRGLNVAKNPNDFIIAYQNESCTTDRGAHNAYDYYGMMSEYIQDITRLEREDIHVGIGVLPVMYESEALIACDKVDNFLDDTSHAYTLNKTLSIGGDKDKLQHAKQALELNSWIGATNRYSTLFSPIIIETLGYEQAQRKTFEELNAGQSLMFYYGHGAEGYIGQNYNYFTSGEVAKLRNATLPLMLYAGCNLSKFDMGRRGIGESVVTGTRFGAVASFFACRDTWSGQNQELFHSIARLMYRTKDTAGSDPLEEPRSLGQIFAEAKTESTYNNELTYVLVGDPALVLPLATYGVELDNTPKAVAGNDVEFSGYIVNSKGEPDNSFNGECVIRFMEPVSSKAVQYVLGGERAPEPVYVDYGNIQASMAVTEVKDGKFIASLHVPGYCGQFDSLNGNLHVAAYDKSKHIGAASKYEVPISKVANGESSLEEKDNIAPTIDYVVFDEPSGALSISVSDNYALGFNTNTFSRPFQVWIDGKEMVDASDHNPVLAHNNSCVRTVQLEGIEYGSHSARIRVKDAAGNETMDEVVFIYQPGRGAYSLSADLNADADSIQFRFDGVTPAAGKIHILDAAGHEVFSGNIDARGMEWDRTSNSGAPVPPGHYKAFFIEHNNPCVNGHSQTIDIPLI